MHMKHSLCLMQCLEKIEIIQISIFQMCFSEPGREYKRSAIFFLKLQYREKENMQPDSENSYRKETCRLLLTPSFPKLFDCSTLTFVEYHMPCGLVTCCDREPQQYRESNNTLISVSWNSAGQAGSLLCIQDSPASSVWVSRHPLQHHLCPYGQNSVIGLQLISCIVYLEVAGTRS